MKSKKSHQKLDWKRARDRLEQVRRTIEGSTDISAERAQAILEQRAQVLAQVPAEALAAADTVEVLCFALGGETYALPTSVIWEVTHLLDFTPIPRTPEFLIGAANLRGQILALVDLGRLLGLTPLTPADGPLWVVVLGDNQVEFGVLTRTVHEVKRIRRQDIHPAPEAVGSARGFLRGVAADGMLLLDADALLHDPRLFIAQGDETGLETEDQP